MFFWLGFALGLLSGMALVSFLVILVDFPERAIYSDE